MSVAPSRIATAAVTLIAALMIAHDAAGLTIDKADVAFNPKKTDSFAVKGQVPGLVLAAIASVQLDFGDFSQTIPIADFTVKSGKLSFKGPKNVPGLATLTIDTVKGKFAAAAKGLSLAPFANPAAFHLVAGAVDECSTLSFSESRGKFKLVSAVPACGFQEAPSADPAAFFVATPTEVRVRVAVLDDLALDSSSLVLLRLDAALQAIGGPLCTLHDDGSAAHGDDTAVDGVFSCKVTFTEAQPAHIRLAVQALRGGVLVLSPSIFLDVVTPLTENEITTVMEGQQAAGDLWDAAFAELGNTTKARKQAVAAILELPGVVAAGVAGDGASIFIKYESGLKGGLDLDPVSIPTPTLPSALERRADGAQPLVAARALPDDVAAARAVAVQASSGGPQVGNAKVLIWAPFYHEELIAKASDALETLFKEAACPHFAVTVLKDEQCTLASIGTFSDYGTVVILTHGAQPERNGDVAFMSGEKATFISEYFTHSTDLKLGHLLVYNGRFQAKKDYFVFFPAFVEQSITHDFPFSIIYAGACTSAANRSMARSFFAAGALAYLGTADISHAEYTKAVGLAFFGDLIRQASTAAAAIARVPFKTPGDYFRSLISDPDQGAQLFAAAKKLFGPDVMGSKLTLLRGDDRVHYPCEPPPPGLVDTVQVSAGPSAHAAGHVKLVGNRHYRMEVTGMTHRQLGADFSDFDAIYCFNSSNSDPNFCKPSAPFPTLTELAFGTQVANDTPGSLADVLEFTSTPGRPDFDAGHKYTFHFNGTGGKVFVETWPGFNPSTGETLTGSFTVNIFQE